ncbi:MAG TPA: pentapeptide repeat-containing protein [Rhabdochlamydiaceae bacterium]|nr:pentapeptide repeat-containing protein [Rhabdochlamydiaceae bacterium]
MTQKDWDIFAKNNPDYIKEQYSSWASSQLQTETLFDVKMALQEAGFSSDLESLSLKNSFVNCRFDGLNFKNCNFKATNFYRCLFDQVTLDNCSFKRANFYSLSIANSKLIDCNFTNASFKNFNDTNCEIINSEFHSCKFNKISFYQAQIIHSNFDYSTFEKAWFKKCDIEKALLKDCDLSSAFIQNSIVKETSLQQADLEDTHWIESTVDHLKVQEGNLYQCVFFDTTVTNSQLVDCDLKNALLLDAKNGFQITGGIPHQVTKPIVALGWNFDGMDISYTKLIRKALIDQGALVIKYSQKEDAPVDLQLEVIRELARASGSEESIGQQLLKKAAINSEIAPIRQRATNILKIAQGLVIPGGTNIEECLYRQEAAGSMITYRSLMELALIAEAQRLQIPTLGVCRGAQMINVYFGGTLKNVEGQRQKQQLEWTESSYGEQLKTLLPKDFIGRSIHNQAADRIGEGLHVVLKHGDVPKLLIRENFIASQFHPEEYINKLKNNPILDGNLSIEKNLETVDIARRTLNDTLENMPTNTPIEIAAKDALTVFLETPFEDLEKARKNVMFIFSNRDIYRFFINKVKSSRPTDPSPPL